MAKFTIITPVFNGADYIESCILSVANQEGDVQHIIMDGGSTDGTQEIIEKHAHHLAYWESTKDLGQSDAINKGLAMADSHIFNWLNADDTLCVGALKEVSNLMSNETLVVTGKCEHVNSLKQTIAIGGAVIYPTLEQTIGRYSMGQPSHFYRTNVLKSLGPLKTHLHYAMDMELWFRFLLKHGQKSVRTTDKILSQFLVREDAKSQVMAKEMASEKFGIFRELLQNGAQTDDFNAFLENYPIPSGVHCSTDIPLDYRLLCGHFSYPLLPNYYTQGKVADTKTLLQMVKNANLLSTWNRFLWELRVIKLSLSK
jgi:glycosyltransferase involved in cell wall biosynthesis